ncbi:hypothetical protein JHL21_02045 [Devosia sp. WQ 349]|uniref:hypothetical protein n=1 Tax=Devosia sp. WQ 349K1 TaxID=2800329 RepID=UPI001905F45E|nr:hypothetical protein [Devosia sp. WQ 349K1]MBK1793275.1 hypothetical protein [Devosia sp. WQ 349K1]
MSALSSAANEMTEQLALEWQARGFDVQVEPRSFSGLEDVFRYYQPDLIATKGNEKFAIEVKSKGVKSNPGAEQNLERVRSLFERHPDWKFQVVYYGQAQDDLPKLALDQLQVEFQAVDAISSVDPRLALIKLWSLAEALVRTIYPSHTQRPQSPGRLVELLAGQGDILPEQAAQMRAMAAKRNRFVHGDLTVSVTVQDVADMKAILLELLSEQRAASA